MRAEGRGQRGTRIAPGERIMGTISVRKKGNRERERKRESWKTKEEERGGGKGGKTQGIEE